jgi:putative membrane protein
LTRLAAFLFLFVFVSPAMAHHNEAVDEAWFFSALPLFIVGLIASFYAAGLLRVWGRAGVGRGQSVWQAIAFTAGCVTIAIAVGSPIHALGEHLLSAHMIEHELLMAVAAPLLAVSAPSAALVWAMPRRVLKVGAWLAHRSGLRSIGRLVARPATATILHAIALWAWHVPVAFNSALTNDWLHWLQHGSFFLSALLFWWVMTGAVVRRGDYHIAVGHLFVTSMHMGVLGALMVVSRYTWYVVDTDALTSAGLTALEDQALAGLIMWVPAGLIYVGAAIAFAGLWIARSTSGAERAVRLS